MTDYKKWDKFISDQSDDRDVIVQEFRDSNSKLVSSEMFIHEKIITDAMKSSEILNSMVSKLLAY